MQRFLSTLLFLALAPGRGEPDRRTTARGVALDFEYPGVRQ